MKEKIFGPAKRKAGVIAVCTVVALTLGASSAFAAGADTQGVNNGFPKLAAAGALKIGDGKIPAGAALIKSGEIADGVISVMAFKVEDGVTSYSTDGGETWSETAPDGYSLDLHPDGSVRVGKGFLPPDEGKGVLVKVDEDGQASYSTDGGDTWHDGLPDGAKTIPLKIRDGEIPAGAIKIKNGEIPAGISGSLAVKVEDGVTLYSTDGGETWSETAPDGFSVDAAPDGCVIVRVEK